MTRNIYKSPTVVVAPSVLTYLPVVFDGFSPEMAVDYIVSVLIHVHIGKAMVWFGGIEIDGVTVTKTKTEDTLMSLHVIHKGLDHLKVWVELPCEGRVQSTLTLTRKDIDPG